MKKLFLFAVSAVMLASVSNAQVHAKYQGEVDLGYSIGVGIFSTGRINVHTIQGFRIGKYASSGLGLGLDYYHELYEKGELVVPIYLNLKGYIPTSEKVSPYFSFDIGVGVGATAGVSGLSGMYCNPAIGLNVGKFKAQFGYNIQRISESGIGINMNAIQIKVGIIF